MDNPLAFPAVEQTTVEKPNDNQSTKKDLLSLLQVEYQALKSEQTARIQIRENALYTNFIAVSAVTAVAFNQKPPELLILLAIPLITCSVYSVYLNQDIMVTTLRRFFADEFPLRVRIALNMQEDEVREVIGSWEKFHRVQVIHRRPRKILNLAFLFVGFLGTSIASLVVTLRAALNANVLWLWYIDLVLVIILVLALLLTADL
jgi:hypothetical protein